MNVVWTFETCDPSAEVAGRAWRDGSRACGQGLGGMLLRFTSFYLICIYDITWCVNSFSFLGFFAPHWEQKNVVWMWVSDGRKHNGRQILKAEHTRQSQQIRDVQTYFCHELKFSISETFKKINQRLFKSVLSPGPKPGRNGTCSNQWERSPSWLGCAQLFRVLVGEQKYEF